MWTQEAIAAGVEAARSIVRGDGADLTLVNANEKAGQIELALNVDNLHCENGMCLLPGPLLEGLIMSKLQEHLEREFELCLDDPRVGKTQ